MSVTTLIQMVVRNSPTLHFYETYALLKQKCGWKEWETDSFVWLKNCRHKENVYNAF